MSETSVRRHLKRQLPPCACGLPCGHPGQCDTPAPPLFTRSPASTPERDQVLLRQWPTLASLGDILAEINALPGEARTLAQMRRRARMLGLRRLNPLRPRTTAPVKPPSKRAGHLNQSCALEMHGAAMVVDPKPAKRKTFSMAAMAGPDPRSEQMLEQVRKSRQGSVSDSIEVRSLSSLFKV